jgi:phospholipase C
MKIAGKYLLILISWGTALANAQITTFKHVIVIFQENRTPDNLFQGLCTTTSACSVTPNNKQYDIQTNNWKTLNGGVVTPLPVPLANAYDLSHSHSPWMGSVI